MLGGGATHPISTYRGHLLVRIPVDVVRLVVMVSVCRVAERVDNVLLVSTSVARVVVIVVRAAICHEFGRSGPLSSVICAVGIVAALLLMVLFGAAGSGAALHHRRDSCLVAHAAIAAERRRLGDAGTPCPSFVV